jgi:lipopolysaccharide/colanic/teichoic acid biosynthesis glycosyltransferase
VRNSLRLRTCPPGAEGTDHAMVSIKRLFDAGISLCLLILCSPLLILAAIGIKLTDPGPVFYKARRIARDRRRARADRRSAPRDSDRRRQDGYWGREFTMYKFRTMRIAPSGGASPITARNDSRVFPFGAFLRATKIDELPQLINVLTGDMTLVGPRPEAPEIVRRHYTPDDLTTLRVAPGVTSPGTVYYYTHCESILAVDSAVDQYVEELLPAKLALDRVYLRRATMLYDVRVILRTIAGIGARVVGSRRFPDPPELREAEGNEAPLPAKAHDSVGKTRTLTQ